MQQRELVSGFSELKFILINTYKIDQSPELVKLYFTEIEGSLLMHDYNDHNKVIHLSFNFKKKEVSRGVTGKALKVVKESFNHKVPSNYLNLNFQLYGFFRF